MLTYHMVLLFSYSFNRRTRRARLFCMCRARPANSSMAFACQFSAESRLLSKASCVSPYSPFVKFITLQTSSLTQWCWNLAAQAALAKHAVTGQATCSPVCRFLALGRGTGTRTGPLGGSVRASRRCGKRFYPDAEDSPREFLLLARSKFCPPGSMNACVHA